MQYQTFPPPPELAHIVEHFWAVENLEPLERHREILIPNGRPTLLLCLGDPGLRITGTDDEFPNASNIAGPLTRPVILEQSGVSSYAAAQLHPWGLTALGPGHLVDESLDLGKVAGDASVGNAITACRAQSFGPERVAPVVGLVRQLMRPMSAKRLDAISAAIGMVDREQGLVEIESLTGALGVSYDALYRLFKAMTGLSPKQYISIARFYHFTGELLGNDHGSLALLASMQGYYDQPHATREFRRYTGISQTRFKQRLNGIARMMHAR